MQSILMPLHASQNTGVDCEILSSYISLMQFIGEKCDPQCRTGVKVPAKVNKGQGRGSRSLYTVIVGVVLRCRQVSLLDMGRGNIG